MDLNEFAKAKTDLEAALRLNPNLPRIYALTGMALDVNGDAAAAEPDFREALKRNPNDFDANLYLGSILYKRRDMAEAKPYLDRAIQLKPDSATARYELAMWESTSGQYDDAAKDLEALENPTPTGCNRMSSWPTFTIVCTGRRRRERTSHRCQIECAAAK